MVLLEESWLGSQFITLLADPSCISIDSFTTVDLSG